MKSRCKIWILFLVTNGCFAQEKVLVLKNATIVDVVNGKLLEGRTVVITGNKITSISKKPVAVNRATEINATGKYLIPGLWDMHIHSLWKERIPYIFPLLIANGVTGIRDMASDMSFDDIFRIRREIETGKMTGPRLGCFTGKILDGPPRPDTILFTYPADTNAAKNIVRSHKEQGACFIKVYNMLSKDIYLSIAAESKRSSIPFAGHVPFSITAAEASNAGQRSIEHLSDILISVSSDEPVLRKELESSNSRNAIQSSKKRMEVNFAAVKKYKKEKVLALSSVFVHNETWQCPTLRSIQVVSTHADLAFLANDARLKYFPKSIIENWKRVLLLRITGDSIQRANFFNQTLKLVADMQAAGVKMLAGTDFPMSGFGLHDELILMTEAGLSPLEALQTATINPAIFLGREKETGTVQEGKLADLVLLDANPLEDIGNIKKIYTVVSNGKLLERSNLDSMLLQVEKDVRAMSK